MGCIISQIIRADLKHDIGEIITFIDWDNTSQTKIAQMITDQYTLELLHDIDIPIDLRCLKAHPNDYHKTDNNYTLKFQNKKYLAKITISLDKYTHNKLTGRVAQITLYRKRPIIKNLVIKQWLFLRTVGKNVYIQSPYALGAGI